MISLSSGIHVHSSRSRLSSVRPGVQGPIESLDPSFLHTGRNTRRPSLVWLGQSHAGRQGGVSKMTVLINRQHYSLGEALTLVRFETEFAAILLCNLFSLILRLFATKKVKLVKVREAMLPLHLYKLYRSSFLSFLCTPSPSWTVTSTASK